MTSVNTKAPTTPKSSPAPSSNSQSSSSQAKAQPKAQQSSAPQKPASASKAQAATQSSSKGNNIMVAPKSSSAPTATQGNNIMVAPKSSSAPTATRGNNIMVAPQSPSAPKANNLMVAPVAGKGAATPAGLSRAMLANPAASANGTNVPPPGAPPQLTNHGGAVLNNPVVSNIYLGSYFNSAQGKADMQHNDAFTQEVGGTGFQTIAQQYGAGAPTFGGSTVVNSNAPKTVTEADVQNLVKQQLAAGNVQPNAQGIYNVVLPPGTVLDAGGGVTSLNGLGGFHGSYADSNGNPVYYSVEAYSKGNNGIDFTGKPQDNLSITESHEWMEAATDPDVNSSIPGRGLGWYDDTNNGEIGDLAMSQLPLDQVWQKDANGFAQQLEWSNQDGVYEAA